MKKQIKSIGTLLALIIVVVGFVRGNAMYWCLGALGLIWLTTLMIQQCAQIRTLFKKASCRLKRNPRKPESVSASQLASSEAPKQNVSEPAPAAVQANIPTERILLRQINYRITAKLRAVYREAVWDWDEKPTVQYITEGGCRRIKLENADEYNFAEVHIDKYSDIKLQLLKVVPCGETKNSKDAIVTDFDVDVEFWYSNHGQKILENIIGELNGHGIRKLKINADGKIYARKGKANVLHGRIKKMLPQSSWKQLTEFFKTELELKAEAKGNSICVSW